MIVASLLLILVAAGLVVVGLVQASNVVLIAAIVVCVVAAVFVYVGSRQSIAAASARSRESDSDVDVYGDRLEQADRIAAAETVDPSWLLDTDADTEAEADTEVEAAPSLVAEAPGHDFGAVVRPRSPQAQPASVAEDAGLRRALTGHVGSSAFGTPLRAEDDPSDEPGAQRISPAVVARLADLRDPVLVVDGRPRYHLGGCVHLVGRESEPLAVGEAQALGFTPCALCEPATALSGAS